MRHIVTFVFSLLIFFSCKNEPTTPSQKETPESKISQTYPAELSKVFETHGSLETWKEMKALSYEIVRENGNEKQWIDLTTRNERIEASNFKTGYDGKNYWLEADTSYKGNPKFYHNLMFYFYAMPFVLADDGIVYSETDDLIFENQNYPGIRISYNDGIGESPEDEYFIHYNPETYQMEWLGYTVTFYTGEKSKKVKWIRYNDWVNIEGLLLPQSLTWYNMEDDKITEPRSPRAFTNIQISKEEPDQEMYLKTEKAVIVE